MSRGSHTRGKLRCYTRVGSDCLGSMPMTRQKPGARDPLTMHTACCGLVAMLPILAGSLAFTRAIDRDRVLAGCAMEKSILQIVRGSL